jgi:hypothetical protein
MGLVGRTLASQKRSSAIEKKPSCESRREWLSASLRHSHMLPKQTRLDPWIGGHWLNKTFLRLQQHKSLPSITLAILSRREGYLVHEFPPFEWRRDAKQDQAGSAVSIG